MTPSRAVFLVFVGLAAFSTPAVGQPSAKDILSVSRRIDAAILKRAKDDGVAVSGPADDSSFLRRLSLDLTGKIPELTFARDFLDNDDPNKRWAVVERFLSDRRFSRHFASIYRGLLLPTNEEDDRAQRNFAGFLQDQFERNKSYDAIVKEILTSPNFRGSRGDSADAAAFFSAGDGKPEDIATATSRAFLGLKIDCAQCHAHPFAKWSRDEFWQFAAFFNTRSHKNKLEIQIPQTEKTVQAKFLDGTMPKSSGEPWGMVAEWVTSAKNPYFAKAAIDHLWSCFFGVSLLEPIVEPAKDDAVTHQELLDLLAREFTDRQFDVKFMIRAIVHTQAYQRRSNNPPDSMSVRYFTHMPVRGMTAEQFFDSLCESAGYPDSVKVVRSGRRDLESPRQEFLSKFFAYERRHEARTSIQQALFVMNGDFVKSLTSLESNEPLRTLVQSKGVGTPQKLQSLFLMTLSRLPAADEVGRYVKYIGVQTERGNEARAWSDVYWVLINSAEFRMVH